jgi:acyl-homoserine-lactone acylase
VLGQIQFVERTNADGSASGIRYPWPGSTDEEGGFNVFKGYRQHGSMALLHNYPEAINLYTQQPLSSGLTTEGYQVRSGSSWMMVVDFSDKRVKARGLMAYSQSSDPESPHYSDQTEYYAYQQKLRPMLYFPREIHRHALDYEFIRRRRH